MPQVPAEKSYFTFGKGLHTESSKIDFPDETTSDEQNYELLFNGSRKRRRGLAQESGGADITLTNTLGVSDKVNSFKWLGAGGDPASNFIVVQVANEIRFFVDSTTLSTGENASSIDLLQFKVSGASDANVTQNPVAFATGRGVLFITGKYVNPLYVVYDTSQTNDFTATKINLSERDLYGIEDGVLFTTQPASLSNEHQYNLYNRGWNDTDITQYQSDQSVYPAKNMLYHKGYKRVYDASVAATTESLETGTLTWDSAKLAAELFGDGTSPQGHLKQNVFDTSAAYLGDASAIQDVESYSIAIGTGVVTVTITGHGYSTNDQLYFIGHSATGDFFSSPYNVWTSDFSFDDVSPVTITVTGADTFTFQYNSNLINEVSQNSLGSVTISTGVITKPASDETYTVTVRPTAVAWYAGRAFWAGIDDSNLADRVYFSRIALSNKHYGQCYQAADPTNPNFNALLPDDGGYFSIPGIGAVKAMLPFDNSLLIFGTNGVWELSGGRGQVFTADTYQVRKVASAEATSHFGVVDAEDSIYWSGPRGIFKIYRDPQTGFLTPISITATTIQTLWNQITETEQAKVKLKYDEARKRLYILYSTNTSANSNQYETALVFDTRLSAFYKLVFPSAATAYLVDILTTNDADSSESNKKVKFIAQVSTRTAIRICDLDQSDYTDFDGNEQAGYLITGYDNLEDFQRFKQAPTIHVFMSKTETGFTSVAGDLVPVNESSVLMRAIWDWSDDSASGKFGSQQEAYRHRVYYQPSGTADTFDDGYPVVVTRNKLRGRGRVLHLRFDTSTAKDSHILGWSIVYKASRKV